MDNLQELILHLYNQIILPVRHILPEWKTADNKGKLIILQLTK